MHEKRLAAGSVRNHWGALLARFMTPLGSREGMEEEKFKGK